MDHQVEESYHRRREQVRRAQKNHRARKATYVKSLEHEVSELRKQIATKIDEVQAKETIISHLQKILISNGLSVPIDTIEAGASDNFATISLVGRPLQDQRIHARFPAVDATARHRRKDGPSSAAMIPQIGSDDYEYRGESDTPLSTLQTPNNVTSESAAEISGDNSIQHYAHPQGLDSPLVGVNFVLALEQPCLNHHKVPSPELLMTGSIGTGHETMLSSPIMERSPPFSFNPFHLGYPSDTQWRIPKVELEALLHFSHELGLDEEVTPIQIWQRVRQHTQFNSVSFEQLENLRHALYPMVKCYGFGAVVDRTYFERAMSEMLSSTQEASTF